MRAPTLRGMTDVTILHNSRCSTSRAALAAADEAGVGVEVVEYLKRPLDEAALRDLLGKLEDIPTDLVIVTTDRNHRSIALLHHSNLVVHCRFCAGRLRGD